MSKISLSGTGVALITPFKNLAIDFMDLKKVINHVINGGVDYLVGLGSTGEAALLNSREQKEVLDFIIEENGGRKPILAGNFTGNNTKELVERIKSYDFGGINALLISSPAYVKPSQKGIIDHYHSIADVSPIPIVLYNVPGRTSSNMHWETTTTLSQHENIIGIKEASGDMSQCEKIIANKQEGFYVTSGDDITALAMTGIGGDGVISVIANALPEIFSSMIRQAIIGNYDAARKLNHKTFALHHYLYNEGNPSGIKAACNVLGLCEKEVRLPLTSVTNQNYRAIKETLSIILG